MNRMLIGACLLGALTAGSAHAELYKWVGPDGKISYSDTPPPSSAKRVETRPIDAGRGNAADLPYELAQAARNHPVTLYAASDCPPCDEGRRLLTDRGVPYAEKTVQSKEDVDAFRKLAGADARLPYLTIGRNAQRGFQPDNWSDALNAAGYPERSVLPKTYRNPPAQALAPQATPAPQAPAKAAAARPEPPRAGELPPPVGNAPPGFRF
jgi:glutaredoxin